MRQVDLAGTKHNVCIHIYIYIYLCHARNAESAQDSTVDVCPKKGNQNKIPTSACISHCTNHETHQSSNRFFLNHKYILYWYIMVGQKKSYKQKPLPHRLTFCLWLSAISESLVFSSSTVGISSTLSIEGIPISFQTKKLHFAAFGNLEKQQSQVAITVSSNEIKKET